MLRSLVLENFRSYSELAIEFSEPVVIICGPNAVGKTNLLEAVFVSSTTKSFRSPDSEILQHTKAFFRLEAQYQKDLVSLSYSTLTQGLPHKQKAARVNNKKQSLSSVVGLYPVVLFEPNDMNLLSAPPSTRRRYLDMVLSQVDTRYLENLRTYKKVLMQRNSLLMQAKRFGRSNIGDHLFVYDVQLSEPAQYITSARQQFLDTIEPQLIANYSKIVENTTKTPQLHFYPNLDITSDILGQYSHSRVPDQAAAHTLVGPHRDNFDLQINEDSRATTPSRGEVRTLLLALKLAELEYIKHKTHKAPILLLDDVFSELDDSRQKHLLKAVAHNQVFITTTDVRHSKLTTCQLIDLSGVAS